MLSARPLIRPITLTLVLALAVAACRGQEVLPEGGNPIPTPIAGENVGAEPESQAADTPEETVTRYIRDSIAAQVAFQQAKLTLRERYQNPDQTEADLGGLVTKISVLEDNSKITKPKETVANAHVALDIRVTFANGDTDTRACTFDVNLQQGRNEKGEAVWYVINPDAFPVFASCTPK